MRYALLFLAALLMASCSDASTPGGTESENPATPPTQTEEETPPAEEEMPAPPDENKQTNPPDADGATKWYKAT